MTDTPCGCTRFSPCPEALRLQARASALSPAEDGLSLVAEAVRAFVAHRRAAGIGRAGPQETQEPRQGTGVARSATARARRRFCRRGHALEGAGAVYVSPRGVRRCKACDREGRVRRAVSK